MANSLDIAFSAAAEVETPNWRTTWGHRAAIASRARLAVRRAVPNAPQWDHYIITITRIGSNRMDDDNLIAACKPVRDEVAQWLGVDDGSPRMQWRYMQRIERVINETPRARRVYRTWVEIRVERGSSSGAKPAAGGGYPRGVISSASEGGSGTDTPSNNAITLSSCETISTVGTERRAGRGLSAPRPGLVRLPPDRLERERTRAPTRSDQDRTRPTREIIVATRPNGSTLRLARIDDVHGSRLRLSVHFVQQGHAWRTSGVVVELTERESLIAALDNSCE